MIRSLILLLTHQNIISCTLRSLILMTILLCAGSIAYADSPVNPASNDGYGTFSIESFPVSGEVIFDGQSYGYSPALIPVNQDAAPFHEVIVRMPGYEDYSRQISYNPARGETVPIVLDATATLTNIISFLNTY